MGALSRRAALGAIPALSLAVAAPAVAASVCDAPNPLADLIEEFQWLETEIIGLNERSDEITESLPLPPRYVEHIEVLHPMWGDRREEVKRFFSVSSIEQTFFESPHWPPNVNLARRQTREALKREFEDRMAQRRTMLEAAGVIELDRLSYQADMRQARLRTAIIVYQPQTMAEVAMKNAFMLLAARRATLEDAELEALFGGDAVGALAIAEDTVQHLEAGMREHC